MSTKTNTTISLKLEAEEEEKKKEKVAGPQRERPVEGTVGDRGEQDTDSLKTASSSYGDVVLVKELRQRAVHT